MITWAVPAALAGLAAVAIPVILHFLGRPAPVEIIFPAIQFLLRRKVAAARIYTLREIIILLLRMAVVALAILIIAGPKIYVALPTCTEKDVIARDVVFFLDNSPVSSYQPPEVSSAGATAFDLYRDLALSIVARADPDRTVTVVPVDHHRSSSIFKSPYHDQARAVLRAASTGELTDLRTAFQISYTASLAPELFRPALVALSLGKLPEVDTSRVLFVQPRPLERMGPPRNYAITGGEFFLGSSPFSRNGVAIDVTVPPDSAGGRVTLYVDGSPQDGADCAPSGSKEETRRVTLSFSLPEVRDARLEVRLDPPDALPNDNLYRAAISVPPWPTVVGHGLVPGGVLDTALEALQTAAGGHQDKNSLVHVMVARGGAFPDLPQVAEQVTRGAGAVIFLPGRAGENPEYEGLLPADPRLTKAPAPAPPGAFALTIDAGLGGALVEAGISSPEYRTIAAALAGSTLHALAPRPGAIRLLALEGEQIVLERPWGRGRIIVVGSDPEAPDSPFRRAPGTIIPFISELAFRTASWKPKALAATVGIEFAIPVAGRVFDRRAELMPPGETTGSGASSAWQPLYVSRPIAASDIGFVPYKAGWWQARIEEPGAGYSTWTVGVNPAKTPESLPPAQLLSPDEALDRLSEAEKSDLSGPLAVLLLLIALIEISASNHLFRRAG